MVVFRRAIVIIATGTLGFTGFAGSCFAQSSPPSGTDEPSSRVGRLAHVQGTVSFHDNDQSDWQPALLNSPITAGDALWTEPKARSEVSIAGTRLRMDSATMVSVAALDDQLTRMQLEQGRVDIKTFNYDSRQPYEVVTPRGIVTIQQQGDYYVEAGSTQDPTRLGVREGAAQLATANGQTVAVRAGEVLEISGDGSAPQLSTIKAAPPPMSTQWAERDRQVSYDKAPQYLSTNVTGYEDLNRYGTWQNDPEYGQVWHVNSPPAGWAPYTTGRWVSDPVYGWTWIDEQPWGFAPYHYGRWAQRNDRWFWVPPDRQQPAVYAPALVAFIGGLELGQALGVQNRRPVGWFPLGPREVYVPPYSMSRDYYRRINFSARVQQSILDDRWQRFERREALREDEQQRMWMNRRFARVVTADDFARSRPVQRALLRVPADKLAAAPVAAIAAPPRPNESIRALLERREDRRDDRRDAQRDEDRREDRRDNSRSNDADRRASMIGLQPEPEKAKAPGPQIADRRDVRANDKAETNKADNERKDGKQALPQLAPRNAAAPQQPKLSGDRRAVSDDTRPGQANAPQRSDQPTNANRPAAADPADRDHANQRAEQPGQANLPPVRDRNDKRPDAPQAGEAAKPQDAKRERDDDTADRPDQAQRPQRSTPNTAIEPTRPDQVQRPAEPVKPNRAAEPNRPEAEPSKPQQAQPRAPQAEPRQQAQQPQQPQQQRQPEPPKPAPQPQPKPERQGMNAPAPEQQPQRAQAPHPAPQQQVAPQQPQQQQTQAPRTAPQPQQAPRQAPAPQQAQSPAPQQQAQQPAPPRGGGNQKDDKK